MQKRRLRNFSLLALVALVAHFPALFGVLPGYLPSTGDTLGAFVPWHTFAARSLTADGQIPLWNPHIFCGMPFLANGQSGLLYPLTYLHFVLPENGALWLFAYLHSVFYMAGGYLLGRSLGLKRRAAFLVALLLGLGNATPAHLFGGHLTFLPTRSYWPWETLFLLRFLRGGRVRDAILWATCVSLGLAAGAPQLWLFGLLFNVALFLAWSIQRLRRRQFSFPFRRSSVVLAFTLCALWCAPILLPLRELRDWSAHGNALSFAEVTSLSATWRSLFRLAFNGFYGGNSFVMWSLPSNPGEDAASLGLAPLLLAIGAPWLSKKRSMAVPLLWCGAVAAMVLALGSGTPLYRLLYRHTVLFRIIRVPARWLELWAFSAALLAGFSVDGILRNTNDRRSLRWLWGGAASFCAGLGLWVAATKTPWLHGAQIVASSFSNGPESWPGYASTLQREAFLSCLLSGFVVAALAWVWPRRWTGQRFAILVVTLLALDPLVSFWRSTRIATPQLVANATIPPSILARYRTGQRWIVDSPFGQLNAPLTAGIDSLGGYEPFGSRPFFEFAAAAQGPTNFSADFRPRVLVPLWRIAGASDFLWKTRRAGSDPRQMPGGSDLHLVAQSGPWTLFQWNGAPSPWPRAYLARADQVSNSWPILTRQAGHSPPAIPGEKVTEEAGSTDLLNWKIDSPKPAVFVDNETLAPGWKAYVDGRRAPLSLANGIFRGVVAPAGKHRVGLVLDSQTLRFSLFLALVGISVAVAVGSGKRPDRQKAS